MKLLILIFIFPLICFSQSPPVFDNNWDLVNLEYEAIFNGVFNSTEWHKHHGWGDRHPDDDYQYTPDNVYLENNYLVLRSRLNPNYVLGDTVPPPIYSGMITSKREDFLYGYYEIECDIDINGYRSQPAFWLWNANCSQYWYEEIDIFEIQGDQALWTSCIHEHPCDSNLNWGHFEENANLTGLNLGYHKYGLEWLPNTLVFYIDDIPVRTVYDSRVPSHELKIVAQIGFLGSRYVDYPSYNNYMKIKSIKVYNMIMNNNCMDNVSVLTQNQFDTYQFGVKNSIIIDGGISGISINSNQKITFRASDSITIDGNFDCPLGSELNLINTTCY